MLCCAGLRVARSYWSCWAIPSPPHAYTCQILLAVPLPGEYTIALLHYTLYHMYYRGLLLVHYYSTGYYSTLHCFTLTINMCVVFVAPS